MDIDFSRDDCGRSIAEGVEMAPSVRLGNNVTLYPKCFLGADTIVMDGAVLGRMPLGNRSVSMVLQKNYTPLHIGTHCTIGANVVLYTGSTIGNEVLICDLTSLREGCLLDDGVIIGRGVMLLSGCRIGVNSRLQDQVHLAGGTILEDHVFLGMGVTTTNDNNIYLSRFRTDPPHLSAVMIRRYAVVAARATILPGVEIGVGAMVAAGAVVTTSVAPWTLVAGVPARVVRTIDTEARNEIENHMTNYGRI